MALTMHQDPNNPERFRVVLDEGDAGIFELDFSQVGYGDSVSDVPGDWPVVAEAE